MDAKEFITERNRMCDYYGSTTHCKRVVGETIELCPLHDYVCVHLPGVTVTVIDEVEKWSKTHPKKTRQSEFLKMFPNANMWNDVVNICPKGVDKNFIPNYNCDDAPCCDCIREYWNEEIK